MGRQPCCDKVGLKKGPWSADEDQKLMSFILQNGHCCWRAVPKLAGLLRCGKSCRLRWTNYLRPDLKRGLLSEAEEQLIIDLHARLGNKWSKIASQLPGRTDNEIKNYWNTHIKKKLKRMGIDPVTHQRIDSVKENSLKNEEADCVSEEADEDSQKQKTEEKEQPQQLLRIPKKENSRNTSNSNNNEVSSSRSTMDSSVITTDDESNSKPPKSCKLPCILDDFLLEETATAKTTSFYPDSTHHLSRSSSSMNFVDSSAIAVPASSTASLEFISEHPIFDDGLLDFKELAAGSEVSFDGLEQSQSQDLGLVAALEQELSLINESCEELQLQEEQEQPAAAPPPPVFQSTINGGLESSTCTSPWAVQIPDMDCQLWQEDSYPFSAFPWDSSSSEAPMIHTTTSTPLIFY